eukprot:gene4675-14874_t
MQLLLRRADSNSALPESNSALPESNSALTDSNSALKVQLTLPRAPAAKELSSNGSGCQGHKGTIVPWMQQSC